MGLVFDYAKEKFPRWLYFILLESETFVFFYNITFYCWKIALTMITKKKNIQYIRKCANWRSFLYISILATCWQIIYIRRHSMAARAYLLENYLSWKKNKIKYYKQEVINIFSFHYVPNNLFEVEEHEYIIYICSSNLR